MAALVAATLVATACSSTVGDDSTTATTERRLEGTISLDFAPRAGCDNTQPRSCLLPFPSDAYTVAAGTPTGRRVELTQTELPRNISGRNLDPLEWNRDDGFSPGTPILLWVPQVDLRRSGIPTIVDIEASLADDAPIVILDAETFERQPFWAEFDIAATSDLTKLLVIRPATNLPAGRRYIVAVRDLVDRGGETIRPDRAFRAYRDRLDTEEPRVEGRRPHMERLFETLEQAGISRTNLYLAWDFTVASTESTTGRLVAMRDDAFAALGDAAPDFEVTGVFELPVADPDDDDADDAADTDAARLARVVSGTVEVPLYLTGEGGPGERVRRGRDGLPERNPQTPSIDARFVCVVPRSASADDPARPVLYGHDLFASADAVTHGDVQHMAVEHNLIYCATDWIGLSAEDLVNLADSLSDLTLFPTVIDRLQQSMLNTLFLGRLLTHPDGLVADPAFAASTETDTDADDEGDDAGESLLDPDVLTFEGDGHGAVLGGALAAVAQDWERSTLLGAGMNHSTLFERGAGFELLESTFAQAYGDEMDRTLALALMQMLWDRTETNGYAAHLTDDPLPDTPAHQVLVHVSFGDFQIADLTAFALARTAGIPRWEPLLADGRAFIDYPFALDTVGPPPRDGSALVLWDSGVPSPPVINRPPTGDLDPDGPHDPRRDPHASPDAREQRGTFLLEGRIVDVCDGAPCTAPRRPTE